MTMNRMMCSFDGLDRWETRCRTVARSARGHPDCRTTGTGIDTTPEIFVPGGGRYERRRTRPSRCRLTAAPDQRMAATPLRRRHDRPAPPGGRGVPQLGGL